jgi:Protein of unknown function (DUF3618)
MTDHATADGRTSDEAIDHETAEKLGEIEQTREAMHDTVEEIGDRLAPAAIVQNAKDTVRDATVGKVEDMADSATQMFNEAGWTAQEAGYGIVETVRRNPIPAALAGIGIAWLVTHRASPRTTPWDGPGRPDRRYSGPYGSGSDTGQRATDDPMGGKVESVGQKVGEIGDRVGEKVGKGVDTLTGRAERVGDRVGEVPDQMGYRVQDLSEQARMLIQDSPLAVGAVAVAVGTALGAAVPATSMERRVLRPATEKAIGSAEETATKALSDMERDSGATSGAGASGTPKASTSRSRSTTSGSGASKSRAGGGTASQR